MSLRHAEKLAKIKVLLVPDSGLHRLFRDKIKLIGYRKRVVL